MFIIELLPLTSVALPVSSFQSGFKWNKNNHWQRLKKNVWWMCCLIMKIYFWNYWNHFKKQSEKKNIWQLSVGEFMNNSLKTLIFNLLLNIWSLDGTIVKTSQRRVCIFSLLFVVSCRNTWIPARKNSKQKQAGFRQQNQRLVWGVHNSLDG